MKVTCRSCGAKYTIADQKVSGRKVKVRCKSCGTLIVVDATESPAQSTGPAPAETQAAESGASAPQGGAAREGDAQEGLWSVNLSDTDQRDMTEAELVAAWRAGTLTDDAFVWRDGMADWLPILDEPRLGPLLKRELGSAKTTPLAAVSPAAPAVRTGVARPSTAGAGIASPSATAPTAPMPAHVESKSSPSPAAPATTTPAAEATSPFAAPTPTPQAAARVVPGKVTADLFAKVASAGSDRDQEEHEQTAPPMPGTTPFDDGKLTGARNENSVLFSLDSLKAGFAPPPIQPARPAGPAPDLFGKSSGDELIGLGGGNPLFSAAADAALLTAPAPPPPPPPKPAATAQPAPGAGRASLLPAAAQKLNPKLLASIAGGLAVLLIIVGAVALSGGDDEEADKTAAVEPKESEPKAEAPEKTKGDENKAKAEKEPPAEAKKEPEQDAAPAAASSAEPSSDATPAGEVVAKAPTGGTPAPPSNPKPVVKAKPSSGVASFDKGAARSALMTAAAAASGCKRAGGPTGTGRAIVTFAPSGRVTSANVTGGGFGGTSVGGCIASAFRRARVPAFSGDPVTVAKSFTLK